MNNKNKNLKNIFFIYDYETFGIDPSSDRPSQFSGIRTDHHFNPIGKSENFFCHLPNDYLPNPEAILLTEIDPIDSLNTGLKEYKFAKKIQKIFKKPKTCIFGYNNIRFDNEFSRNLFYRNFYDPYDWSWRNENSNWDLLHVMRALYILRPEGITWPLKENKIPSFKLEDLTKSNNITHNKKHDALSDVYATIKLAKLAKRTQPKLFNYLYHHRKKTEIKKLINIKTLNPLLYIPTHTFHNYSITCISPLIWHPNNPNLLIAFNLNINFKKLIQTLKNQKTTSENYKNQEILIHIYINKCPILTPINSLRPHDISRLNINPQNYLNNFKKLKEYVFYNNTTIKKILKTTIESYDNYHKTLKKEYQKLHVDKQLYTGFFNQSDQKKINTIPNSTPETLAKSNINFFDNRLKLLLFYYRARNFPNSLNPDEKNKWLNYKKKLFTEKKLTNYTKQIYHLLDIHKKNDKKTKLLNSLIQYLKYINKTLKK